MILESPSQSFFLIGTLKVSWYGLCISFAILIAYFTSFFLGRKRGVAHHVDRVVLWALVPAVLCARLLFVIYHLDYFSGHLSEIVAVWNGGWVWHGALIGGLLGIWAYCKKNSIPFLPFFDLLAPGVALGQSMGRWGNFFNQEAYGLPTFGSWGLAIDEAHRLPGFEQFLYFHPTFLYESVLDLGIGILLLLLVVHVRKSSGLRIIDGATFFMYTMLYSTGRFFIECLRIDTVPVWMGIRAPQWISLFLVCVAGYWFLQRRKNLIYLHH